MERGQHLLEYAILISVISLAFSGMMFFYTKGRLQGIIKDTVDAEIGDNQSEALQDASLGIDRNTVSTVSAVARDTSEVSQDAAFEMFYNFSSTSNASGSTVNITTELK